MQPRTHAHGYHNDSLDKHAEKLIDREVLACQSALIDSVLQAEGALSMPMLDDATNLYQNRCPDCGEVTREATEDDQDEDGDATPWDHVCTSCTWQGDHPDNEPQEVMEWWLVSRWLAGQLEERGEVTLSDGQSHWWGRCCSGQAILLDGIMQTIIVETGWCGWPQGSLVPADDQAVAEDPRA